MPTISKAVKADPQFQALVEVLGTQAKAKAAYDRLQPAKAVVEVPTELDQLIAAGFTKEQAEKALAVEAPVAEAKPLPVSLVKEETVKERHARQVDEAGLAFTKGRVYVTKAIIEAVARTLRNGSAQVVQSSGTGRVSHVLVTKEESGDVSIQNLTKKS